MGGSSRRQTVGYRYFVGIHAVFCRGPIDAILKVFFDDRDVFNGSFTGGVMNIDQPNLFGGESREGGIQGDINFQFGGPTQTTDSYLVTQNGSSQPAYRNVVSAVFRKVYLGINPYLKKWGVKAQRVFVRQNGLAQWYPERAGILVNNLPNAPRVIWLALFNGTAGATSSVDSSAYAQAITHANTSLNTSAAYTGSTGLATTATAAEAYAQTDASHAWNANQDLCIEVRFEAVSATLTVYAIIELSLGGSSGEVRIGVTTGTAVGTVRLYVELYGQYFYGPDTAPPAYPFSTGVKHHFEFNHRGADHSFVLYIDGIAVLSGTFSGAPSNFFAIDRIRAIHKDSGDVGTGLRADDARVTTRLRRHTAAFTPPTATPTDDTVGPTASYYDMNPVHVIREALTDPDFGMGNPEGDIGSSFATAADTIYTEGMGVSYLWQTKSSIEDFIRLICRHIDAAVYVDPVTGQYEIKLIRDDYTIGALPVLDPSNVVSITDFARTTFNELVNCITAKYWDGVTGKDASVTVSDIALVAIQQTRINTDVDYPAFTTAANATRAAQRDLRASSTPRISCVIEATSVAADFKIGDPFVLTWPDYQISSVVMRVTGLAFGDGRRNRVRITCIQDVFGIPATVLLAPPVFIPPVSTDPAALAYRLIFELPYLELVQRYGQSQVNLDLTDLPDEGLVGIAGVRPQASAINARVFVDSGAGYTDAASLDFCPTATSVSAIAIDDTSFELENGVDLDDIVPGEWLQVDSEIMAIVSYAAPILTVKRGCLDTVPVAHTVGSRLFFWDSLSATDEVRYVASDVIDVKLCTVTGSGQLAEASAPVDTFTLNSRAIRPYPPANVQINGAYYPASAELTINLTWVHRDRLQQTSSALLGFLDGTVGPEVGVTYNARAYDNVSNALIASSLGVSGTSTTLNPPYSCQLRIELEAVRDGYTSFQAHTWVLDFTSIGTRATELGEIRVDDLNNAREEE